MAVGEMIRYSVINQKNKREIVLLRGSGCKWKRCRFCDYHLDFSADQSKNYQLNQSVLSQVKGLYGCLEVINSGSFTDLDEATITEIEQTCIHNKINRMHIEAHWMHRNQIAAFRERFHNWGIEVKFKIGTETFDIPMREEYFYKGMGNASPEEISRYFQETCLLMGVAGQTQQSMEYDIQTGLKWFDRICINIMQENNMPVRPSDQAREIFLSELYPKYQDDPRVDILINNTDFGVGEEIHHA